MDQFHRHKIEEPYDKITDWWCGQRFRVLRKAGFFTQRTDIALAIHYDGVQAQDRNSFSVAPVILFIYNLPPKLRYDPKNTLLSLLIPGPREPRDLSSFLRPPVDELAEMAKGTTAFDAFRKCNFELKSYAVLAGGMFKFMMRLNETDNFI